MRRPHALAALLALAPFSACTCSTPAPVEEEVTIDQLTLTFEPAGAVEDGVWVVAPRSNVTVRWGASGDVGRVVLAAGEQLLASADGAGGGSFTDDCGTPDAACLTAEEGTILFTLTVLGAEDNTTSATRSLEVTVRTPRAPLRISAFTADDAELAVGGSTTLRLAVEGADSLALVEVALDGTERSEPLAPTTTEVAVAPVDTTTYRLEATTGDETVTAEVTVGVRPVVTLAGPETAVPGETIELAYTSLGATELTLSVDGTPVDVGALEPSGGTIELPIDAAAAPGTTLALSLVGTDDEEPARASTPAELAVELVAP